MANTKREPNPYNVWPRGGRKKGKPRSVKPVWYVEFRNDEGILINPVSTGQRTETAARTWCNINRDRIVAKSYERSGDPLKQLLTEFYAENSKVLLRRGDRGETIGDIHRKHCEAYCRNYFIPFFHENDIRSVHDITRSILRELQDYIRANGNSAETNSAAKTMNSVKTTNSAISALRVIFDYLMDEEEISNNPCYGLKHLVASEEKEERGAFELRHVQTAFKLEWEDNRDYLLSILGASCGLRNSEINALRVSNIVEKNGHHYLNVKNAYNATTKTKTPAGKRTIPLHPEVVKALLAHIKIMGYESEDYLFWESRKGKLQPLPPVVFGDSVVHAAKLMGVTEKYLNDNNITFYGWRHFYNSLLIAAGINPYRVKVLMGHTLDKHNDMTGNYFKQITDDTEDIIAAVGLIFKP